MLWWRACTVILCRGWVMTAFDGRSVESPSHYPFWTSTWVAPQWFLEGFPYSHCSPFLAQSPERWEFPYWSRYSFTNKTRRPITPCCSMICEHCWKRQVQQGFMDRPAAWQIRTEEAFMFFGGEEDGDGQVQTKATALMGGMDREVPKHHWWSSAIRLDWRESKWRDSKRGTEGDIRSYVLDDLARGNVGVRAIKNTSSLQFQYKNLDRKHQRDSKTPK